MAESNETVNGDEQSVLEVMKKIMGYDNPDLIDFIFDKANKLLSMAVKGFRDRAIAIEQERAIPRFNQEIVSSRTQAEKDKELAKDELRQAKISNENDLQHVLEQSQKAMLAQQEETSVQQAQANIQLQGLHSRQEDGCL